MVLLKIRALLTFSAVLALVAGFLIVISGYRSQGMLFSVLSFADQKFGGSLPSILQVVTNLTVTALAIIISLGGILVIIGGIVLLLKRVFTGRLLILLGGGFGFLGILIAVGIAFVGSGIGGVTGHLDYWIGVVLASIARYIAKK